MRQFILLPDYNSLKTQIIEYDNEFYYISNQGVS